MHDIIHNIGVSQIAAPQTIKTVAVVGEVIDTQGIGALAVAVLLGNAADTLGAGVYVDLKIEHADDNGNDAPAAFAPCTAADISPDMAVSAGVFQRVNSPSLDNTRYAVEYRGGKRFVRVSAVPAGLDDGLPLAMLAMAGNTAQKPGA